MRNFLAAFCDDHFSLFIKQSPNLRTRAFTLLSNHLFHRFPRSIDHSFSLSDYRKLILSTFHVCDTKTKMIAIAPFHRFPGSIDRESWKSMKSLETASLSSVTLVSSMALGS